MLKEIERKFIIEDLPSLMTLDILEVQQIYQVYLAIGKEQVRARQLIRNNDINYTLTIKRGHGLLRDEIEAIITKETYQQLCRNKTQLIKTRSVILINGIKTYIDQYYQHKLIIAEVEFPNEYEAKQFQPPEWFGREVTGEFEYENQYLWKVLQKH